jgi:hypothetical protein
MTYTPTLIVVSLPICAGTGGHRTHHVGDIRRCHLATLFGAEKESFAGVNILPFAVSINHRPSSQHYGLLPQQISNGRVHAEHQNGGDAAFKNA